MNLFLIAHEFVSSHQREIFIIAKRHKDLFEDVCQDTSLVILEIGNHYDPQKGSFESYIFGHLNQVVKRKTFGPSRFAISLNSDFEISKIIEKELEKISFEKFISIGTDVDQIVGHATLESVADAIGARSSAQLAKSLKLTKRRINQILTKIKKDAGNQFGLDFDGDKDD